MQLEMAPQTRAHTANTSTSTSGTSSSSRETQNAKRIDAWLVRMTEVSVFVRFCVYACEYMLCV